MRVAAGVLTVLLGIASPAMAVDFSLLDYNVNLNYPGSGLSVWTQELLQTPFGPPDDDFSLDIGESMTVKLFRVGTKEEDIDADDWIPYLASVNFIFTLPTGATGHVWGITGGGYFGRRIGELGYIAWDNPLEIAFSTGEVLEITLSHEKFGVPGWADVEATFHLAAGGNGPPASPVPEPSSIVLLTLGAGALLARRRKRV